MHEVSQAASSGPAIETYLRDVLPEIGVGSTYRRMLSLRFLSGVDSHPMAGPRQPDRHWTCVLGLRKHEFLLIDDLWTLLVFE